MSFVSLAFPALVALALLIYYLVPKSAQWKILLAVSYAFYLCAGPVYLIFILYTTLVTYLTAIWMQKRTDRENGYLDAHRDELSKEERKAYRAAEKKKRFRVLLLGLFAGFGMLAVLKYTGFVVSIVASFQSGVTVPNLILPLGISFYTFQSMGYLIDVYRAKATAERNLFRLALFVSFFPQLLQGPISRFGDLAPQLFGGHGFEKLPFRAGLARAVYGYFKKMVIADTAMIAVRALVEQPDTQKGGYTLLLILLYSAVIYGDFTGGIDITIGISEMFGIRLAENFDRPFSSESVKEYWNRWHITMGTWFTDYVFYPLSVSSSMQKLSKWSRKHLGNALGKRLPVYFATVVTWFLTGLWHGAGWNFIVWGLLNCFLILLSQEFRPLWNLWQTKFPRLCASRPWHCFRAIRTFLLMGWIRSLDCYRDVPLTFRLWGSVFTVPNWGEVLGSGFLRLGLKISDYILLAVGILFVFFISQLGKKEPVRDRLARRPVLLAFSLCLGLAVILLFGTYGIGFDAGDFIYRTF